MVSSGRYVGGCITLFFGCMLCSAAGVGGGGINVPILLLIFGYSFATSVKLSLFLVLGNALAQNLLNFGKAHPKYTTLPLIFWELVIVLSPAQLGGSNIGNILADILPDSVLYIIALLVLSFASGMSTRKGVHRFQEEQEILQQKKAAREGGGGDYEAETKKDIPISRSSIDEVDRDETIVSELHYTSLALDSLGKALGYNSKETVNIILPVKVIFVMFLVWAVYTAIIVGIKFSSKCSTDYIILDFILYVPLLAGEVYGVWNSAKLGEIFKGEDSSEAKSSVEVNSMEDFNANGEDPKISSLTKSLITRDEFNQGTILRENALRMFIFTFFIGIICSLLGIGGGELLSPLMLFYHLTPQVTSATSAMLSLINTSAQVLRTLATASGIWSSGIILFLVGFLGGFIGRKIGLIVSFEYNRSSFIIFALVAVLILSSIYYVVELATMDFELSTSPLC